MLTLYNMKIRLVSLPLFPLTCLVKNYCMHRIFKGFVYVTGSAKTSLVRTRI